MRGEALEDVGQADDGIDPEQFAGVDEGGEDRGPASALVVAGEEPGVPACRRRHKRKNWLFAGSDEGAASGALLYSVVVSCKELEIDPFVYLRDVFGRLASHPSSRVAELTPRAWKAARPS